MYAFSVLSVVSVPRLFSLLHGHVRVCACVCVYVCVVMP